MIKTTQDSTSSRRLCVLSYHTCPLAQQEGKESGGMNVYVLELSLQLAKIGWTIDIFTRCTDVTQPRIVQVLPTVRVIHLDAGPETNMSRRELFAHIPTFAQALRHFISEEGLEYDLVHSHYYMSALVLKHVQPQLFPGTPSVVSFHTLGLMKNLVAKNATEFESPERIVAEHDCMQEVDRIISPSHAEKEYMVHLYQAPPRRVTVIEPGVDLDKFHPLDKTKARTAIGADPTHKIIVFAGRIEPLKGIDVLLYATKILLSRHRDLHVCVWIVGGDVSGPTTSWSEELQRLEMVRSTLGLDTNVSFAGQQPQDQLPLYFNAAEMVVMPSHYESFGMVAAEALACGVPVITTNVTGVSRLVDKRHSHLVTSVQNPLLLAKQMSHILLKPEQQPSRQELRATVLDLDWPKVAREVAAVYEEVIEEREKKSRRRES